MNEDEIKIYDVCIIGAGASGLAAAITAARRGKRCIIIDKNKKCGQKLYATGNGRCNIANAVLRADSFFFNEFANAVMTDENVKAFYDFFESLGIPFSEKDSYLYPVSMQASAIVWALKDELKHLGVVLLEGEAVKDISFSHGRFQSITEKRRILSDKLILATGSPAAPKCGGTDEDTIYGLYKKLGLKFNPYRPVLTPLKAESIGEELHGVRVKATAKTESDGRTVEESGELQLVTGYLSGIMIFNLSYYIRNKSTIKLDLIPDMTEEEIIKLIRDAWDNIKDRKTEGILNAFIPDKLAAYFTSHFTYDSERAETVDTKIKEISSIVHKMKNWEVTVTPADNYDKAQSAAGGVKTDLISPENMRVTGTIEGLYVTGEAADVTGKCGGYNLMWAFITGMKTGNSI
ncbi:MAG: aminoacetone oxidase family FAD-binding enzyme [Eubacterium sp.]|nr:aminoacetone oxidase family FAD-binding enzyme [Eubacterium sp.]